jgi:hypothetical protein
MQARIKKAAAAIDLYQRTPFVIALFLALMTVSACQPQETTTASRIVITVAITATSLPATQTSPPANTPTSTPSPTPQPSQTPTQTPSPSPTITNTPTALPGSAQLGPLNHQWQTLNNCHRASIATLMAYYYVWFTQHDHDLAMDNLDEFVTPYGLKARIYGIQFSPQPASDMVRWLLAEEIPVIVGQDLSREDNTWHYRVAYGYNDASQEIHLDDPLLGPNLRLSYETFNTLSRGVGQLIPVYPTEMDETIQAQMKAWQMKLIEYPR